MLAVAAHAEFVGSGGYGAPGSLSGAWPGSAANQRSFGAGGQAPLGQSANEWTVELEQAAWSAHPSVGLARAVVAPITPRAWQAFGAAGTPLVEGELLQAYDLDASLWWNRAVGAVISARVVDDVASRGAQALLADVCAAWRVARDARGAVDFLAGARIAASSTVDAGAAGAGSSAGLPLERLEGVTTPMVGMHARSELADGVHLSLRADISPQSSGAGAAWSVGGGVELELGRNWSMSVEARWRSLDAELLERFGGGATPEGGAIWVGFSRSF